MVFRNFFAFYVLPDRTPTGGKSKNMGFLGHFGPGRPWALGEIQGPGRNRKKANPRCKGSRNGKISYYSIWDGCLQLFYTLRLGRPDPQGREIAKYGNFRPFWPRMALGTSRNLGAGPKTEKWNFPVLGALLGKKSGRSKNFLPESAQLFLHFTFWPTGTPRGGNREIRGS